MKNNEKKSKGTLKNVLTSIGAITVTTAALATAIIVVGTKCTKIKNVETVRDLPVYDLEEAVKTTKKVISEIPAKIIANVLTAHDRYLMELGALDITDDEFKSAREWMEKIDWDAYDNETEGAR